MLWFLLYWRNGITHMKRIKLTGLMLLLISYSLLQTACSGPQYSNDDTKEYVEEVFGNNSNELSSTETNASNDANQENTANEPEQTNEPNSNNKPNKGNEVNSSNEPNKNNTGNKSNKINDANDVNDSK